MSGLGKFQIDDVLTWYANTTDPSDGSATDASAGPTWRIYEEETATPILTGTMSLLDSTNTAGFYSEQVTLSTANGFEEGKSYGIYMEATVAGITGAAHHHFKVEAVPATVATILSALGIIVGAVNDAAATTTDWDTDGFTEATTGHFNGSILVFTGGALTGQSRVITTYTATGQNVAFDEPWTEAPANNDPFIILHGARTLTAVDFTEPSQGAIPITMNLAEFLPYLLTNMRNKATFDGTWVSVFADDGTTVLFKFQMTTAGGTTTRAEAVTGP